VTTAATIWAVAALGMVIGAGFAGAGIALSVMVLGVLTTAAGLERRYLGPCRIEQLNLVYATTGGKAEVRIQSILEAFRIPESGRRLTVGEDGLHRLRLNYCSAHKHHHEFLPHLAELAEVVEIHRQAVSDGAATGRPER
jgi:uncharacterized membrane protein YhiD involved in acid resistance